MTKKLLLLMLAGLLVNLSAVAPVRAATKAEKEARFAEKVKEGVKRLGTGRDALIEVKLRDKTKLKGYISEIGEDGFSVTDAKGASTHVPYVQVKQAKGNNLSTGQKIMIGVGIALVVVIVIALIAAHEWGN
jgi:hypothetical protein